MKQIFISYGRKDAAEFARRLADWLRQQGYQPWLDVENGIPIGAPFDVKIELGISGSDALIAVLSPWGLRPESLCRNELLFAQWQKKPLIPVRIADVTPPIQIVSLNYIDAVDNPDAAFAALPDAIRRLTEVGGIGCRDWAESPAAKPWWAAFEPRRFEEELARHGGSFTGRKWLFEQIRDWAQQSSSRLLLLTADTGFGKSAAAAQMTARLNVRGVHFCTRSVFESCQPRQWLAGLVYQLAAQFPAYRQALEKLAGPPDWSHPPESLFRQFIADPLGQVRDELQVEEPWIFVVDALDESFVVAGAELADLLAESAARVPDFFRIVVTSRADRSILARFELDGVRCQHLRAQDEPNRRDLTAYIERRVCALCEAGEIAPRSDIVPRLSELADGNFLFAKMTLDALTDADARKRLSVDELGTLPRKLGGLYHAMFRKRFKKRAAYKRAVLPLLDCLVAARGPLPDKLLRAAAGLQSQEIEGGLGALSQFLSGGEAGLRLFHQSLGDWLRDPMASAEFVASAETGHQRLAAECWREFQGFPRSASPYTLAHLVPHLAAAGRLDDAFALLTDLRWVEAKCRAGLVFELQADYREILAVLPEVKSELTAQRGQDARVTRWTEQIIEYAHSCNLGETHAALPEMLPTVVPWSEEKIQAECRRIVENPTRLDRLRAFSGFVQAECYPLRQFGSREGFVLQHAFNQAPAGPVHDAAIGLLPRCGVPLMLRRWPNDAAWNPKPALFRSLEGHTDRVWSVSVTPDGRRAVSGSSDESLRVWDLESGACVRTLESHSYGIWSVSVTPDGRCAVSGSGDNTVRVWDLENGECLRTLEGHSDRVCSVCVTPDGWRAVSGSYDKTLRLWDLQGGTCLRTLKAQGSEVLSVSATPDARCAVSGSRDGILRVWDLGAGNCLRTLEGHGDSVRSVCVTPNGRLAVSGSLDKTVRVWDLESGTCLRILQGHSDDVLTVSVTPDGRRAVSCSRDKTVRVWDLESGTCLRILEGHSNGVLSVAVTPDGRRAVSGSSDKTLRAWSLENGACTHSLEGHSNRVWSVSVTPDGRRAVSGSWDQTVRVWDLASGACLTTLEGHSDNVLTVSVTPDGRRAVSCSRDKTVRVWDLESGACLRILEGQSDCFRSMSVTPDGRRAVSGSYDKTLRLWDLEGGTCLRTLDAHSDDVLSVSVTPDGRRAVSANRRKTLRVWDLENGACLRILEGHNRAVKSVSVTADGRRAVSAGWDETVRVWDLESGACLHTLLSHGGSILSVSVTPDGRRAVSGGEDKTIRVWDLESGACLGIYVAAAPIDSVALTRCGTTIFAGTTTGATLIVDVRGIEPGPDL